MSGEAERPVYDVLDTPLETIMLEISQHGDVHLRGPANVMEDLKRMVEETKGRVRWSPT